jgi:hypothetical protein
MVIWQMVSTTPQLWNTLQVMNTQMLARGLRWSQACLYAVCIMCIVCIVCRAHVSYVFDSLACIACVLCIDVSQKAILAREDAKDILYRSNVFTWLIS